MPEEDDLALLEKELRDLIRRWREIGHACELCATHLEDTLTNCALARQERKEEQPDTAETEQ